MQYRPLGRTGLRVSHICLGTMTWGEQNSEAEAHAQLDMALAAGVNFVDTAEMYPVAPRAETYGRTEEYIGSWLAKTGRRHDIVLASKVIGPGAFPYVRGGPRLDRDSVIAACETSLRRLRTDYLDLYQVHWPQRPTNFFGKLGFDAGGGDGGVSIAETLGALAELQQQGKIRHIGVSNETPWGVGEYLRLHREQQLPRIASIQNPYSLLNRSFEVGLAEIAQREEIGLLAYSPLAMGVLSGKYLDGARPAGSRMALFTRFTRYDTPTAEAATRAYVDLAREHGLDPAQMALAFVNSRPFTTANIIGATSLEQLQRNLASATLELPFAVQRALESLHRLYPIPCP
ncbi:NADP(H)-dependent aldo-keto reductase [Solimonas terrae]|uniref:Protein tas n=1 Tax=Solimonas terrae TaxID=1396819 RepID=A0A6M2BW77_9GAMM|nr:NADP(H)-dependent aldo-keto reductase [Solimonas terrae]NGY06654.1 NADP(H)-dependent aldo-keto reductase [Solimonas terrae]